MVAVDDAQSVKVYTVNGAAAGSASSLPDWLVRKRAAKAKGKRAIREHVEGAIELIQHFEFPEASNRVKSTRDGHHVIATGTYKPQIRVWDLDQLALKFERHADIENVDFIILSNDWTKTLHLQADRTIELHTQGGFYYRTRIPRFGRALAYHFPTCDALFGASGNEVYRLNLEQGRYLTPLVLGSGGGANGAGNGDTSTVAGVNAIDINPAHGLWAFGIDGNGTVEFWDPRSRSSLGVLVLPRSRLIPLGTSPRTVLPGVDGNNSPRLSVTALASRTDGLSYAVGTSTGHTLLYDIRSRRPFALKDQGYGLPVKRVSWIEGGAKMAGDGLVVSADKKVIKIWDRNSPSENFTSLTPATDLNDVHHIPGSGLLMTANEGIQMTTYYIPQLGPAPRWCSFLENITEELEDSASGARTVYEDYKFVSRAELATLGLDHLVGTPALKPYMHGYFLSLKLYDAARVIANPYVYEEHRAKIVQEKLDKLAEGRIRTRKDQVKVKVNKALAEQIVKEEERAKKREERKRKEATEDGDAAMDVDVDGASAVKQKPSLLSDARFAALFEDPEFEVDEESREYALLHPSTVAHKKDHMPEVEGKSWGRGKTAVEDEEEESDRVSSDDDLSDSGSESSSNQNEQERNSESEDSSEAGDLVVTQRRPLSSAHRPTNANVRLVPLRAEPSTSSGRTAGSGDASASFGHRRQERQRQLNDAWTRDSKQDDDERDVVRKGDGSVQVSWIPNLRSSTGAGPSWSSPDARAEGGDDERDGGGLVLVGGSRARTKSASKDARTRKGVERFGAGLEKGGEDPDMRLLSEQERSGRTQRRRGMRSGSKNAFRQTQA
ncbi:WD40-repeat-containing domain protein [Russula dissimulans]|nr:WD40-repeat-containing domain protein [Russula dissimulans]